MEEKKTIKITCPNCNKTGNYAIKPNYCAFCGTIFLQEHSNNHNKLIFHHNKGIGGEIMNLVDTFQNRLKQAMDINNMKQVDLVEKSGLDKTLINKYLAGISKARQKKLSILADVLNVNEVWLLGYDVPMVRDLERSIDGSITSAVVLVYGTIPAGIPMECIEDIIDTEEIPASWLNCGKQFFGLKIKGTSMSPTYLDKDTIILEKVDDCESGQDAVVMVNGNDGTFKRVFKNENGIILQPLNPEFQPMVYSNEQIESLPVKIIGIAREIRRKI